MPTAEERQSPKVLRTSRKGIEHIKGFEKLRLKAYDDGYGNLTIGWGHLVGPSEPHQITEIQAVSLLMDDIRTAEYAIKRYVKVPLYQHEWDAIVGLVFNIGVGNFSKSTLVHALNEKRYDLAANEFPRWRRANGQVSTGLVRRRAIELRIFLNGQYNAK